MAIIKDIPELLKDGVITPETADSITAWYNNKKSNPSRLFLVFGVLGAVLTGLGIILVIAHNWDELSRTTRAVIAFLPIVFAQALCLFTLLKRQNNGWRETSSILLFFGVGASISLVSQVYHIPGELHNFLFIWMLLVWPLIYLMRSSVTSLLYIGGITWFGVLNASAYGNSFPFFTYWLLLVAVIPHYYLLFHVSPRNYFTRAHHWFVAASLAIMLAPLSDTTEEIMVAAYFSLFSLYYLIGTSPALKPRNQGLNGYHFIGAAGIVVLLLAMSFDTFWESLRSEHYSISDLVFTREFLIVAVLSLAAVAALYFRRQDDVIKNPATWSFVIFLLLFFAGVFYFPSFVVVNLLVLALGIYNIRKGIREDHLGILNYGLLIITALILCRFFDSGLSFVIRGLLFIVAGAGFFLANMWVLKKRKSDA